MARDLNDPHVREEILKELALELRTEHEDISGWLLGADAMYKKLLTEFGDRFLNCGHECSACKFMTLLGETTTH